MKWARLMCGREFRVESVMLLWDHMFASAWLNGRPGLPECIENVAVSMVRLFVSAVSLRKQGGCPEVVVVAVLLMVLLVLYCSHMNSSP